MIPMTMDLLDNPFMERTLWMSYDKKKGTRVNFSAYEETIQNRMKKYLPHVGDWWRRSRPHLKIMTAILPNPREEVFGQVLCQLLIL